MLKAVDALILIKLHYANHTIAYRNKSSKEKCRLDTDEILINFKMIKSIFFVQVIIFFGVPFINIFKNDITKENIHIYDILAVL